MDSVCHVELENRRGDGEEHRSQWAEEAKRLISCEEQLEADCRALERQRRDWELHREEEEHRLDERAAQLHARRVELESKRRALEEQRSTGFSPQRNLSEQASPIQEQEFQMPADAGGLGLDAYENEGPWPNEHPNSPEAPYEEPSARDFVAETPSRGSSHADEPETSASVADDMESVHEYVEKLLARVRGTGRPSRPLPDYMSKSADPEVSNASTPKPSGEPPFQVFPPRNVPSAAVEKPTNLAAMREIAKLSRELALERNARRTLRRAARGKLILVAVTSLAGGLLLAFRHRLHFGNLPIHAAQGVITVSVLCAAQYVLLSFRIIAGNRSKETPSPEPATQPGARLTTLEPVGEPQMPKPQEDA